MQNTPHELREKCLTSLHSALVSNSGHLLKLGLMGVQVTGFYKFCVSCWLIFNAFSSQLETAERQPFCFETLWPTRWQAVAAIPDSGMSLLFQLDQSIWRSSNRDNQGLFIHLASTKSKQCLLHFYVSQIFISFACLESKYLNLNAHIMVDLLTRLLDMGQSGGIRSRKHQVALQTAAVQNMQTFAKHITINPQHPVDCDVNQAIPIIQFLCDKLEDGLTTAQAFPIEFSLETIQALLSNLPDGVVLNSRSHSFVWRTLCPTLLKLVGIPCPNAQVTDGRISELRCVARYT